MNFRHLSTIVAFATALALGGAVPESQSAPLTSLAQVLKLSNADAEHKHPFHLRAQITLFDPKVYWLFVQDGPLGIYVFPPNGNTSLRQGDWIEIEGVTAQGLFAPVLDMRKFKVLSNSPLPAPVNVGTPGQKIPESANIWAVARGRIYRSEFRPVGKSSALTLNLRLRTGESLPILVGADTCDPNLLVDADVVVHGILGTIAAGAGNHKSDSLMVLGCHDIEVTTTPAPDWSLPVVDLDRILTYRSRTQIEDLVHVHGVVTLARWVDQFSIQQGKTGILVEPIAAESRSKENSTLRIGESVEVLGRIIQDEDGFRRLVGARVRPLETTVPIEVQHLEEDDLHKAGFAGAFVCAQGEVLSRELTPGRAVFGAAIGGSTFTAELPLPPDALTNALPEVRDRAEFCGVARLRAVPEERRFDLRLASRSRSDITIVVKRPLTERIPWGPISVVASGLASGALLWVVSLRNRVRARTRQLVDANSQAERARALAEEASRVKGEFLANMSHEIRTPMNGILGAAELMLDTPLSSEQKDLVETARFSAENLLVIINDILDSSKIEAGKLGLDFTAFPLQQAFANAIRTHAVAARKKGLRLICNIQPEVPAQIVTDPTRLTQVLTNLIGNAIKFTHHGEVEARVHLDNLKGDAALLHFSVRDTGIGIPKSKQKSIFEPFSQADASTTREFGGTGLGLTISAKLIEMLGGRIWVESEVGKGSCFHFTFTARVPAYEPAAIPPPVVRAQFQSGAEIGLRILLAEDNMVNQKIAVRLLQKRGHSVTTVGTGRAAVDLHQRESFDLILMDVQMPEMDGFEATASIRNVERISGEHMPIIALTAHAMVGDRERCLDAGMDGYASKPLRTEDLNKEIERLEIGRAHVR